MRVARKHHLCEKYIMNSMEVILAAGGTSASEEMLDTVEIFFIVNEVWSTMVQALPRSPASSALVNINQRDNSYSMLMNQLTNAQRCFLPVSFPVNLPLWQ